MVSFLDKRKSFNFTGIGTSGGVSSGTPSVKPTRIAPEDPSPAWKEENDTVVRQYLDHPQNALEEFLTNMDSQGAARTFDERRRTQKRPSISIEKI